MKKSKITIVINAFLIISAINQQTLLSENENQNKKTFNDPIKDVKERKIEYKRAVENLRNEIHHQKSSIDASLKEKLKQFGSEQTIKNLEEIFKCAPLDVQQIVTHLKNPDFYKDPSYRYAIFVGPPGSGKTTTAKAIAYKMMKDQDWEFVYIEFGELLGKARNEAAVKLRTRLEAALSLNKPVIVVIDELNELLENSENSHYDTSATAKYFWQFLDNQHDNPNFFLIGTMNRDTHLPQPFKNRIFLRRFIFEGFRTIQEKSDAFLRQLHDAHVILAKDIDTQYIEKHLESLPNFTGRDLHGFILLLKQVYRKYIQDSPEIVVEKCHFEEAIELYLEARMAINHDSVPETDQERQERHFVQKILIDNCMRLKTKTHTEQGVSRQKISEEDLAECEGILSGFQQLLAKKAKDLSQKMLKEKQDEIALREEKLKQARKNQSWNDWFRGKEVKV